MREQPQRGVLQVGAQRVRQQRAAVAIRVQVGPGGQVVFERRLQRGLVLEPVRRPRREFAALGQALRQGQEGVERIVGGLRRRGLLRPGGSRQHEQHGRGEQADEKRSAR
jgi:hypothetical protein